MNERRLFGRWVRATWAGWLLGIPLIIIFALIGEVMGIGGLQFLVGAGMGTGVGLMQSRVLRGVIDRPSSWIWSCVVGLTIPFLVTDISNLAGVSLPYWLYLSVIIGGAIAGAWQARILSERFEKTWLWIAASVVGWGMAAGTAAISDYLTRSQSLRGLGGLLAYLGMIASGGLILGLVTGAMLVRMFRNKEGL
jgi:hypothetical protein